MDNPHKMIYQTLKGDEIRLLTLVPGLRATKIRCSLEVDSLDRVGAYEGLSYTWGLERSDVDISLDNHSMPVTRNLYEALEALRLTAQPRKLWVDALCINQADLDERASQVSIMRRIYKEASKVIVWLGPQADNSDLALDLFQKLSGIRQKHFDFAPYGIITLENLPKAGLPGFEEPAWAAVNSLLERSWFSRVWVIQEVAVSKESSIRCGDGEIAWEVLANALRAAHEAQLMTLLGEGYNHVIRLQAFREQIAAGSELPLAHLLVSAHNCLATDARDKIFALLGLGSDTRLVGDVAASLVTPSYEKPVAQVFTEFVRTCFDHYGFLDILSSKVFEGATDGLPSWVPDWSKHQPCTPLMIHGNPSNYSASKGSRAECSYGADGRLLHIRGTIVDEVAHVGSVLFEPEPDQKIDDASIFYEWACLAEQIRSYPGGAGVDTAFMLTMIANTDVTAQPASGDHLAASLSWYRWIHMAKLLDIPEYLSLQISQEEDNARATLFHSAVMRVCYGRRYFLTKNGYMGIGPSSMKTGHLVCIAKGASVPLILDETRTFVGGHSLEPLRVCKETRFVGESYVHGLLDGEGYDEGRLEEICLS
ncbi:het-domain-containing [Trichoderma arundinaceum]|uniref:Het-domain-containing n=1 Tax=Trichoderma arundinaceum TaxID=490622 RepID=A0A395NUK2_TRIAR|nr:het-domain-containing [Trichoderma arundinaceum]